MKGTPAIVLTSPLLALLLTIAQANAQELWLRPEKYFFEPNEQAVVEIQGGENFIGEPVPLERSEISVLENWNRTGSLSLVDQYQKNEKAIFSLRLPNEGYQFVFMKGERSYELEGDAFNEYLKQYGLDRIYAAREARGNLENNVRISVTHYIQLSLRTGRDHAKGWNKPLNLPLEIIPDKNPETLRRGDRIHFKILEDGKPAFGVRVKIWNRWDNRTTIQNIYTEKDGTISTTISNPGDWMVTVVKLKKGSAENDYLGESFCLLFGYR